ncbi:MAG: adenylate/guanylate cyclase domain-containing protein [Chloroflexi bacterium]|nr:adenylate/guanylate cyclase domain-containing protein [Chloroflexota bacterium]
MRTFLNGYFRLASDIFIGHDAIVDKFLGDCTMAIFGAPIARPDHPSQAVEAAVELQRGYRELTAGQEQQVALGIGINTGEALVGNVGSEAVKDWTAIGDTVNVASRLQGLAKAGEVLMTAEVYRQVAELYPSLEGRALQLEGRQEPVVTYSLVP